MRARVREQQAPVGVERRQAVGGRREQVGVALEHAQALLGFDARVRVALRLVAQRLQDARVAQRDRGGVREHLAEAQLLLG